MAGSPLKAGSSSSGYCKRKTLAEVLPPRELRPNAVPRRLLYPRRIRSPGGLATDCAVHGGLRRDGWTSLAPRPLELRFARPPRALALMLQKKIGALRRGLKLMTAGPVGQKRCEDIRWPGILSGNKAPSIAG